MQENAMPANATRKVLIDAKAPKAARPAMPPIYGISKQKRGMIRWEDVCERLERSRNYWVCTTRADGRPHAMPVWGFWIDGNLFFGTGRSTVKGRNMARNPNVVIHLESGDDAVILECVAEEQPLTNQAFRKRINAISTKKYNMPLMEVPESVLYRARPKVVFAWREKDFPTSATKWVLT
jgi:general stress protein 26